MSDSHRLPVLQSFIDLIRHGKHHQHARQDAKTPVDAKSPSSPSSARSSQQKNRDAVQQQERQQQQQSQPQSQAASQKSPAPKEAAEMIVNEEREQKSKMPTYKGLEKYKLLEKMGECVPSPSRYLFPADGALAAHSRTCTRLWRLRLVSE